MSQLIIANPPNKLTYQIGDILDLFGIHLIFIDNNGRKTHYYASNINKDWVHNFTTHQILTDATFSITINSKVCYFAYDVIGESSSDQPIENVSILQSLIQEILYKVENDTIYNEISSQLNEVLFLIDQKLLTTAQLKLQSILNTIKSLGNKKLETQITQILNLVNSKSNLDTIKDSLDTIINNTFNPVPSNVLSSLQKVNLYITNKEYIKAKNILLDLLTTLDETNATEKQLINTLLEELNQKNNTVSVTLVAKPNYAYSEFYDKRYQIGGVTQLIPIASDYISLFMAYFKQGEDLLNKGLALLDFGMLKDWIFNHIAPTLLPLQDMYDYYKAKWDDHFLTDIHGNRILKADGNFELKWQWPVNLPDFDNIKDTFEKMVTEGLSSFSLDITTIFQTIMKGIFNFDITSLKEEVTEFTKSRLTDLLSMLKSIVMEKFLTIENLITLAKRVLGFEQTKKYYLENGMLAEANGLIDIGFDISWIMDMLSSFAGDLTDITSYFNFDTIKELITSNIISFDNLRKFLPDLGEPVDAVITLAQDIFKEGKLDANEIKNLITQNILKLDWVKDKAAQYGISEEVLDEVMDLFQSIEKEGFKAITDPDVLAKMAKTGIDQLPAPYNTYSTVAADLIRYPEQGLKEAGQEALNWAGSQADVYIQQGTDKLFTVLDSTPVGNFLKATGMEDVVKGGVSQLAIYAKDEGMQAIGSLFGLTVKAPSPPIFLQYLNFKDGPEKAVYYIKESLNFDSLSFTAMLSDGTIKDLAASAFDFIGFDSSKFMESASEFADLAITLKDSAESLLNAKIPRSLTVSEKKLLQSHFGEKAKLEIRNAYGTIVASDEDGVKTIDFNYQILPIVPINLVITSPPSQDSFILGSPIDISGMIGLVTYSDNQTTATLDDSANICITGYDNTKVGSFTAYANYQGFQAPFTYSIRQEQPLQIQIERNPDTTCYYVGDSLKVDGIVVKATYGQDDYGNDIIYPVPAEYLEYDKATFDHVEDNRIISINYMGCTDTFSIKVVDLSLIFLQTEADPVKNTYIPYERIDLDGLIVLGIQGDTTKVQLNADKDEYSIEMLQPSKVKGGLVTDLRTQHYRATKHNFLDYHQELKEKKILFKKDWKIISSSLKDSFDNFAPDVLGEYTFNIKTNSNIRNHATSDPGIEMTTRFKITVKEEPPNFYGYFVTSGDGGADLKERYINGDIIDLNGMVIEARYGLPLPTEEGKEQEYSIAEKHILDSRTFEFSYYYEDKPNKTYTIDTPLNLDSKTSRTVILVGQHKLGHHEEYLVTKKLLLRNARITALNINKTNLPTEYNYGDVFDSSILDVNIVYSDGYIENVDLEKCTITGIDTSKVKKQKVVVQYLNYTDNYTVTVNKGSLKSISIRSEPLKMTYYIGESFNPKGMEVYAIYDTGYEELIALNDTRLNIVGFFSTRAQSLIHVYIDYCGQRAVIHPSIVERNIAYITFEAPPNKVIYQVNEIADWTGLTIVSHSTDNTTKTIPLADLTIAGFDSSDAYGEIEILVEYLGYDRSFSLTFPVFIIPGPLESINIINYPVKTTYGLFETLDLTGLIVTARCENNVRSFDIPTKLFSITGFDTNRISEKQEQADGTFKDVPRYVYLTMTNLAGIQPIYFAYYVHDHNFKDIMILPPTVEYIPLYYVQAIGEDSEEGGGGDELELYKKHKELYSLDYLSRAIREDTLYATNDSNKYWGVTPEHIPFKGGSVVELYEVDGNTVTKTTDLAYVLNAPVSEWVSSCRSDIEYDESEPEGYKNTKKLILSVTRILNDRPVRSDTYIFKVLMNVVSFSTVKPKLTESKKLVSHNHELVLYHGHLLSDTASDQLNQTETNIFIGQLPNCKYVHCEYIYINPEDGSLINELCFAIPYNTIKKSYPTFDQVGIIPVYPETTYAHFDKMAFVCPVGSDPNYKDTYGIGIVFDYKVQIIDLDAKPKSLDILTLPNKLDYDLDDEVIDLTGMVLVQTYSDGTYITLDDADLKVSNFDTSTEGTHKVVFTALDGAVNMVYDIEVKAIPNALFINCLPNITTYYSETYQEPDLIGLEVQAQFKDRNTGHIYHQDIDNDELIIEAFDNTKLKSHELLQNSNIGKRVCSVSWRGARTFFEYSVIDGTPVDIEIETFTLENDNNIYITKKQTRIDAIFPKIYLKDVIVHYIYPDKSKSSKLLTEILEESGIHIEDLELQLQTEASQSETIETIIILPITIMDQQFYLRYLTVKGGIFNILTSYDASYIPLDTNIRSLTTSNNANYNITLDVLLYYSNSQFETISLDTPDAFEFKDDYVAIGSFELDAGSIVYIKDGYYIPYPNIETLPTLNIVTYSGTSNIKINGIDLPFIYTIQFYENVVSLFQRQNINIMNIPSILTSFILDTQVIPEETELTHLIIPEKILLNRKNNE